MRNITIAQVEEALPKIAKVLKIYIRLIDRLHAVDVSLDQEFRSDYKKLFSSWLWWKNRSEEFRDAYFQFLELNKNNEGLTFEEVLDYLREIGGQEQAVYSSALLSVINPKMPVCSEQVQINLDLRLPRYKSKEHAKKIVAVYEKICLRAFQELPNRSTTGWQIREIGEAIKGRRCYDSLNFLSTEIKEDSHVRPQSGYPTFAGL